MSEDGGRGDFTRRDIARAAAASGAFFAIGTSGAAGAQEGDGIESASPAVPATHPTMLDVRAFGATGDGVTDDTAAVQRAIDAAAEVKGAVFVSPGTYACSTVKTRRNVAIVGIPAWDYRKGGGSILKLIDEKATCLVDFTDGQGVTIDGLSLDGGRLGTGIHGIFMNKPEEKQEDACRIERTRVYRFSGDGVRLMHVWCFTIRQSSVASNRGDGVFVDGWDGFLSDNWLSGNGGCGYGRGELCSVTMTANRIEWNKEGGILLEGATAYNITGNYIDRSGKAGIAILPSAKWGPSKQITVTGNVFNRSGAQADPDSLDSAHLLIDGAQGVCVVGNVLMAGQDDFGKGTWTPSLGIVCRGMTSCIIKDNTLHNGALNELVRDLGGHGEGVIVKDNVGQVVKPAPLAPPSADSTGS